jgi:alpha-glucosidase
VFQIYVRSFADSNGDGIGDLPGITSRLPYIKSLGVDAIWLNPCFPSPQRDHGYDVSDYFNIEPDYGTLSDFSELVEAAHSLGLRVLLDVVPNHCSNQHAWFQEALAGGPGCAARSRFWFRPGRGVDGAEPPNNWQAIFGGSAWTRVCEPNGQPGEWYLGLFTPFQPDWNFGDPSVVDHFHQLLTFWFDLGVDGFRADAVIYLGKTEGLPDSPLHDVANPVNPLYTYVASQHEVWRGWRSLVDSYEREHNRQILLVAEAFTPNKPEAMTDYVNPMAFHQSFAFDLMFCAWNADRIRGVIDSTLSALQPFGLWPAWTLNNHDTQRGATRFGRADVGDVGGFHEGSFATSTAPIDVAAGEMLSRAAALFVMALPGCVYLYAGEELGLPEVFDIPASARQDPVFLNAEGGSLGRDGCRVPLPWSSDAKGAHGFSNVGVRTVATTAAPWLPQPAGWGEYSVETQDGQMGSTLELYRTAGRVRAESPDFHGEDLQWLEPEDLETSAELLAFRRGQTIIIMNLGLHTLPIPSAWLPKGSTILVTSEVGSDASSDVSLEMSIASQSTIWFRKPIGFED